MKFFRRLDATLSGELLAAQVATTSRPVEAPTDPDGWIPAPDCPEIWAAFAVACNSNGVIDYDTAAPFLPAAYDTDPEGTS